MLTETSKSTLERLRLLTPDQVKDIAEAYGTPVFAYSEEELASRARTALAFEAPFGLTVRYAMKANPLAAILMLFDQSGIHIDASSGYEAERAMRAGIKPERIMVTSQELPRNLEDLVDQGVKFNACSLHQLETYGRLFPRASVAIRLNIGLGSGHTKSVSVAGPTASFGIWHEHLKDIHTLTKKYGLTVSTLHSHIGCGSDPKIWHEGAKLALQLIGHFPSATTLNLGGGFKVARMSGETATDLAAQSRDISRLLQTFATRTGHRLHLEIEPGTFLTANAGTLISRVQDITNTGANGFTFLKLDAGMNDIMRPALHAGQHPIIVINNRPENPQPYVVVGHNCESTDLLTPDPTDSEVPQTRQLQEAAIGDLVAIEGVGAYVSAMRLIGYNSFPAPNEVLVTRSGDVKLIRRRQEVTEFIAPEVF